MIDGELGQSAKSPERAILLQSPGRKPWVNRRNTFIEPQRGGTNASTNQQIRQQTQVTTPNRTSNDIAQSIRQQAQTTTPNQIRQQAQTTTPNNN